MDSAEEASVSLRLGNVVFVARIEALSAAGGMLAAMFAHRMRPGDTDTAGSILIQRDPTFFNYVMQYVHGESLELAMLSTMALELLVTECDYFQLPNLAFTVRNEIEAREQLVAAEQRQEAMKVQQLKSERNALERALGIYLGKYKDPGCLVVRATARIGERVTRRAAGGYPNQSTTQRKGTITSVTEDNGTEIGVMWDRPPSNAGSYQSNCRAGKRGERNVQAFAATRARPAEAHPCGASRPVGG